MVGNFNAGLALAGKVVKEAKEVSSLSQKGDDAELREAAANLREQTIDLKETVSDMRQRILELEDQLAFKKMLTFNGKVFEYEENGKKIYICNGCEVVGKYTHMTEIKERDCHLVQCPACKNEVYFI